MLKEELTNTSMSGIDLAKIVFVSPLLQNGPWNLSLDSGTISSLSIVIATTSVVVALQSLYALLQNGVVPFSVDVGNEANTASISFTFIQIIVLTVCLKSLKFMRVFFCLLLVGVLSNRQGIHREK